MSFLDLVQKYRFLMVEGPEFEHFVFGSREKKSVDNSQASDDIVVRVAKLLHI